MTEKKITINTNNNILLHSSSTIKTNNSIILKDNNAITTNKLYKLYKTLSSFDYVVQEILVIPQMTINKSYCVINIKAYYNKIENNTPYTKVFGYNFSSFIVYYNSGYTTTNIKLEQSSAGAILFTINTSSNIILRVQNPDTAYSNISYGFVIDYHYNNFS